MAKARCLRKTGSTQCGASDWLGVANMNTGPVGLFNLPREKWGRIYLMIALEAYLFRLKQT